MRWYKKSRLVGKIDAMSETERQEELANLETQFHANSLEVMQWWKKPGPKALAMARPRIEKYIMECAEEGEKITPEEATEHVLSEMMQEELDDIQSDYEMAKLSLRPGD